MTTSTLALPVGRARRPRRGRGSPHMTGDALAACVRGGVSLSRDHLGPRWHGRHRVERT
jgi:hypothetical protein